MKNEENRWVAVRRGPIYCAPACGGGCTHAAYLKANADAKKLCETLDRTTGAKGWTAHVWENLGWHHSAISACGRIKVHPFGDGTKGCTAFLGKAGEAGGTWAEQGKTPALAVAKVIETAKEALAGYGSLLAGLDTSRPVQRLRRRPPLALVA